jgi:hypothetical protein
MSHGLRDGGELASIEFDAHLAIGYSDDPANRLKHTTDL